MPLTKVQAEGVNLADTFAFSGTISGLPSGSEGFSARGTGGAWTAASNNDVVAFNNDSTGDSFDTGSNYNTSTYKYTAPATGLYIFWYAIYAAEADSGNEFTFLLDSARVDFSGGTDDKFTSLNSSDDDHIQNATIVVPMTSGQTMAVIAATGSDYYMPHCSWGGCRLS